MKRILSLYDYSGNWSLPYREAGYEVVQVDLKRGGQDVRLLKKLEGGSTESSLLRHATTSQTLARDGHEPRRR